MAANTSQKNQDTKIEDFSGQNFDNDALNALDLEPTMATPISGNHEPKSAVKQIGADLSGTDLKGADLSHADLTGANLAKSNLAEARLDRAILEAADLRGADLRSAHLTAARLEGAKLYGAIFNQWTDLPFAKDEAIRRGMIYMEITSEN